MDWLDDIIDPVKIKERRDAKAQRLKDIATTLADGARKASEVQQMVQTPGWEIFCDYMKAAEDQQRGKGDDLARGRADGIEFCLGVAGELTRRHDRATKLSQGRQRRRPDHAQEGNDVVQQQGQPRQASAEHAVRSNGS